ncbi:MAG: hypothetical protein M0Z85_01335 [Gammaproteobacteria bacterium]|nr:hypothetical protein [Gammaproteobacteria bacterium]
MSNEMKPETPLDAAWAEYVQELNTFAARNAFDAGYRAGERERSDCVEKAPPGAVPAPGVYFSPSVGALLPVGTFKWAMFRVALGDRVRRKEWGDRMFPRNFFPREGVYMNTDDFSATDWEVVGE